jgi:hypothetical protein
VNSDRFLKTTLRPQALADFYDLRSASFERARVRMNGVVAER